MSNIRIQKVTKLFNEVGITNLFMNNKTNDLTFNSDEGYSHIIIPETKNHITYNEDVVKFYIRNYINIFKKS